MLNPPASEGELLARAGALAGRTLGALADEHGTRVPRTLKRAKGWVGEFLERLLGASAQSRPVPDFEALGIEMKTIPLNEHGQPRESTYVSTVPLAHTAGLRWEDSAVRAKLARVLWIPVEAARIVPLRERRLGRPILWSPSPAELDVLRADWEEHMERVALGRLDELDARLGTYLQVRPKAYNGAALTAGTRDDGAPALTLPRGFYLRTAFTRRVLEHG